ncbi:hypothetical protein PO124_01560 [Bacillus licheniformis]|nr:hypothetical protein [Bacillus licheniformis]
MSCEEKPLFRTFMCAALIGSLLAPVAVQADTGTAAKTKEQSKYLALFINV